VAGIGQFAVIQSVARSVGIDVKAINLVRYPTEIENSVAAFARAPNGGLILTASALSAVHRDLIISLAARHKLPATYQEQSYAAAGGLVSYGPNFPDQYRRAAGYVDRILRGEKPADLPVQAPTIRADDQSQDRQNARPRSACDAARTRRRGDRIKGCLAAIAHSRSWHVCDIARSRMDFRFRGKSGRAADISGTAEFDPKADIIGGLGDGRLATVSDRYSP
jgi:ABC transporter substrate binding protein